jgi:hypothetical protein
LQVASSASANGSADSGQVAIRARRGCPPLSGGDEMLQALLHKIVGAPMVQLARRAVFVAAGAALSDDRFKALNLNNQMSAVGR